jgi:mono/diheme cytochrome c family protein
MKFSRFFPLLASLILLLLSSACLSLAEDITPPPGYSPPPVQQLTPTANGPVYPAVPPDPGRGEAIYLEKCAPCHGLTGLGDGTDAAQLPNSVPPIGSVEVARLSTPTNWHDIVTQGNIDRFMPPFTSLSDRQRWDVLAYIYTLSAPVETVTKGEEIYSLNCASCHGDGGGGDGPDAAGLPVVPTDFTDLAFMAQKSSLDLFQAITDGKLYMPSFVELDEGDRWALTAYLRSLTFAVPMTVEEPEMVGETDPYPPPEAYPPPEGTSVAAIPGEEISTHGLGSVEVQVVSGSGVDLPSDLQVVLHGYDNMAETYSQTLDLSETGVADFLEVPMPQSRIYFATAEFDGVVYSSNFSQIQSGIDQVNLGINVYETTTNISVLKVDRLHIFFDFIDDQRLSVIELMIFSNQSGQTLMPAQEGQPAITFSLPEGASNLSLQDSMRLRYLETGAGFGVLSVLPSEEPYEIMYAYEMPYDRDKLDLTLPINLRTTAVIVMAPEEGVKVKSDQLEETGLRDVQGVSYSLYTGDSLVAGDILELSLSGRPKSGISIVSTTDGSSSNTSLIVGIAAFGVALIVTGLFFWRRSQIIDSYLLDDIRDMEDDYAVSDDSDDLMDAIIALDDLHQAGELPDDAYLRRRFELKERLKALFDDQTED